MKHKFAEACRHLVTTRPETSYDNFLRDFGERFVPGYKSTSTVDLSLASGAEIPIEERSSREVTEVGGGEGHAPGRVQMAA